jgi:hypothetical protein
MHLDISVSWWRNAIRKGLVYELMHAQGTTVCSYFAQRNGERSQDDRGTLDEIFQGLINFK